MLIVPLIALLSLACAPADQGTETASLTVGSADAVAVTLEEWSVAAAPSTASAGDVTFEVSNQGTQVHNFVVFRTDLAADQLPVENAQVTAGGAVEEVGRVDEFDPGSTETLTLSLDAGSYVLVCNVPGHYEQGMRTAFSVGP